MIGKLIKHNFGYNLLDANGKHIATSKDEYSNGVKQDYWLSLKNCQEIENGYDLDELVKERFGEAFWHDGDKYFKEGFQKALQIFGNNKFSVDDLTMLFAYGHQIGMNTVLAIQSQHSPQPMEKPDSDKLRAEFIQSLQQTEWQVEILTEPMNLDEIKEQGKGFLNVDLRKFKLDSDKCLILKRI